MKKHIKKLISSLMAISLAAPIFSGIPVFAENSDGTIVEQTQALTVVGKRIKGDDTYFEISLEVNDDYDKYSSVGVVLRYDPDYIIPAESWDEGAGAADMSENTTWATRRALPTLGLETWSTHTALAYQEDTAATGSGGKKYGYLYLGAEHPLTVEGTSDSTASSDSSDSSESDPAAPAAEPEASPEPGTRPVVVARFMYKTDETVSGKTTKDNLVDAWINGTNNSGAVQSKGTNWDYDWTANKILTIASDEVAGKSPAQYPFAIYTQDYEEKAFMRTWPTVTTTVPPAPGDPTPTPMPISAYAPEIGAGVDPANHLTRNDIMIITCEGESAKATGGLKLSDIFVILFFDWDDSLIGTLTAGVGQDSTPSVNDYVKEKFIYPDLRTPTGTELTSNERIYNYRGEYPAEGPGGSTIATDGGKYPLTNKIEYCFAGKDLYENFPFAGGWTRVLPSEIDYAAEEAATPGTYPGVIMSILPHSLENTWTALDKYSTYGKTPLVDASGVIVDDTGTPISPAPAVPDILSYDFSNVKSSDLNGGALYVKAVYTPGEWLDKDGDADYISIGPVEYGTVGEATASLTTFSIAYKYKRINQSDYGVTRNHEPAVNMALTQVGATASTPISIMLTNAEIMDVLLTPTNAVDTVGYQLRDSYGLNVVTGASRSQPNTFGLFELQGGSGLLFKYNAKPYLELAYQYGHGTTAPAQWLQKADLTAMKLSRTTAAAAYATAAQIKKAQTPLIELVKEAEAAGVAYTDLSWYQLQYAVLRTAAPYYVPESTAKTYCETYPKLIDKLNS